MGPLRPILLRLAQGALSFGLLLLPTLFLGVEAGEPLGLRWLRKLAEHPVRGSLALALALEAARRASPKPRSSRGPRKGAPEGGSGLE